ncbi:hypothetical protein ACHAXR_006429 [Thalassiosira sp. AJA248-18]
MSCSECSKTWQTYEKGYVDTLDKEKQMELDAIIVGKSNGIDMGLVTLLRSGDSALSVQRTCIANLVRSHEQLKASYVNRCKKKRDMNINIVERAFPNVDISWAAKQEQAMRAFVRDYLSVRPGLLREMGSLRSQVALAIDHQAKVVRHAKGGDATQSFTVVADTGLVLGYYCVPTDDFEWVDIAMKEIVKRHGAILDPDDCHKLVEKGNLPAAIYVDKDCCNGKEHGRTEDNKHFYGMIKLLDAFHLILRIGREINSEHGRKSQFMRQVSQCIFETSKEDVANLEAARQSAGITDLSSKQQKYDRRVYVRRVIREPAKIVSKLLMLLKSNIAMDREARLQFELDGKSCDEITPAHDAYPLVTKKLKDRAMYTFNNIRQIVYDGRVHWKLTNSNRQRLRDMGQPALPDSVAPSEVIDCPPMVASTDLRIGFDYCHHVMKEVESKIEDAVRAEFENPYYPNVRAELDNLNSSIGDIVDYDIEAAEEMIDDAATDAAADDAPSVATGPSTNVPFMADIPDLVDFDTLEHLAFAFEQDLELTTTDILNLGIDIDLDEDVIQNGTSSLADCLHNANQMAVDAGIDLDATGAGEPDIFSDLQNVNRNRNVALRRAQNQKSPGATPDFNDEMKEKWLDIWADPQIPQPRRGGTSYFQWYVKACSTYEKWRMTELSKAHEEGTTPPPLYRVPFTEAKLWSVKMKEVSRLAYSTGVVNETTAELRTNLDVFIGQDSPDDSAVFEDAGGIGVAVDIGTLNVHVSAASHGQHVFESPTNQEVNAAMVEGVSGDADPELLELLSRKSGNKRKRKSETDPELQCRIKVAAEHMKRRNISRDDKSSEKNGQMCVVCGKFWDYELPLDGGKILHRQIGRNRFRFCPLADDQSILKNYLIEQEEKKKLANKKKSRRRRSKKDKDD